MQPFMLFEMQVYTHYVKITRMTPRMHQLFGSFCQRYVLKGFVKVKNKMVMVPVKVFAVSTTDHAEVRLHINQLPAFITFLEYNHVKPHLYNVTKMGLHQPLKVDLPLRDTWALRDEQPAAVDYLVVDNQKPKILHVQMGKGKSKMTLAAASRIGLRTLILIKSGYMDKWCADIIEALDVKLTDLMTVNGAGQLKGIMDLAVENQLRAKIIIMSSATYRNFLKLYELDRYALEGQGYDFTPDDMLRVLQVGTLVIDEVHQEFHANFKSMLYTNVHNAINLSATLINNNPFMTEMYNTVFPIADRFAGFVYDRYIKAFPYQYSIADMTKVKTTEFGSTVYSHNAFERSIISQPKLLKAYKDLIDEVVDFGYLQRYERGDRCAVYASSIVMCTILTEYFAKKYPQLKVRRYVQEDPYVNCVESDIVITTILSGGTAVDIPGLTTVVMTINVLSAQSNVQTMGRLRKLHNKDTRFLWLWCRGIPKHYEYNDARIELIKNRVALIKPMQHHSHI